MTITRYTAMPPYTTFLYPTSRQYPFDEVCEKIVRALEKRNWKVPGIQVEFKDTGTGELKYRTVRQIKGEDFKLLFSRCQPWPNTAAITDMVIPSRMLSVYEDEGGPSYYIYVGGNWEKDKDLFMNGSKSHSKLDGKPRTYLSYTGRCGPLDENGYSEQRYAGKKRNPYLVNDDESGKEYKAGEGDPKYFHTQQVFQEMNEWLNANLLKRIEAVDEAKDVELTSEPIIPYPEHIGPFYIKIYWKTYNRIVKGKEDKSQLKPPERYALTGEGEGLVKTYVKNDGSISEDAYDGFKSCSFVKPVLEKDDRYCAVLSIIPKHANRIFVVDKEAGNRYQRQCIGTNSKNRDLTEEESYEYQRCIGRTIVPIHQYKGNYEKPIVLIGSARELSFDEVEIVDVVDKITESMKNQYDY